MAVFTLATVLTSPSTCRTDSLRQPQSQGGSTKLGINETSGDSVIAIHGDGGYGGADISNGGHIASPVGKAVANISLGHQVDHGPLVEGETPGILHLLL